MGPGSTVIYFTRKEWHSHPELFLRATVVNKKGCSTAPFFYFEQNTGYLLFTLIGFFL